MSEVQRDLIAVYTNVLREVEGGQADFEELKAVLSRNGIELDDDLSPVVEKGR